MYNTLTDLFKELTTELNAVAVIAQKCCLKFIVIWITVIGCLKKHCGEFFTVFLLSFVT